MAFHSWHSIFGAVISTSTIGWRRSRTITFVSTVSIPWVKNVQPCDQPPDANFNIYVIVTSHLQTHGMWFGISASARRSPRAMVKKCALDLGHTSALVFQNSCSICRCSTCNASIPRGEVQSISEGRGESNQGSCSLEPCLLFKLSKFNLRKVGVGICRWY